MKMYLRFLILKFVNCVCCINHEIITFSFSELCDKLPQYQNINLKCFWRGRRISCNSRLKAGTVATAECAFNYKSVKNIPDLVCNDNGHWNELSDDICLHFDPWNEHGR